MKLLIPILLVGMFLTWTSMASAANREGALSITPVIGGYTFDGKQDMDKKLVYGIRGGYNLTKAIGIEALFDYVNTDQTKGSTSNISMQRYGAEALYHFIPDSSFVPYLAAGYSGLNFNKVGNQRTVGAFDYGIGAKYFLNESFALRGDVRHIIYSDDKTYNNLEYTIGAHIPFGGVKPAIASVEPVQVLVSSRQAPPVPQKMVVVDSPKPPSTKISITPASIIKGQSATLTWSSSNATDCTILSDIGSVQPSGVLLVTPGESTSYTLGCRGAGGSSISETMYLSVTTSSLKTPMASSRKNTMIEPTRPPAIKVLFDFNKAAIKTKYQPELKKVGTFLKDQPAARVTIVGHTDNVGSKKINKKLSKRRAENGRSYIVKKFGIDGKRIVTKGVAYKKPVASNKTKKGKASNRRIEVE